MIWFSHSISMRNRENICPYKEFYKYVHSILICNSQTLETNKCSSKIGWLNNSWDIHTVEYYSELNYWNIKQYE